jgi:hypothetical protein
MGSADICSYFFEPVFSPDTPPPASPPPPEPDAPKKSVRKKKRAALGGANRHRCRLCNNVYTQAASTGYTNLLTHLRLKHANYEELFQSKQLPEAASETPVEAATSRSPATPSASSSVPTGKKRQAGAGRKRGPVYEHFEDLPVSPGGSKHKKMRCVYCHEDTPQLSGKLKLHLSAKCTEAPEDVKAKYSGAVGLVANKGEALAKVARVGDAVEVLPSRSEAVAIVEARAKSTTPETPSSSSLTATLKSPPATFKPLTTKLQRAPAVRTPSTGPASKQATAKAGDLATFEDKLTTALIATNAPWHLLDNEAFRDAMETLRPASVDFLLSAARARSEVLDRLSDKYDRHCRDVLASSNAVTVAVDTAGDRAGGATKTTYVALTESRRAFVLAEGGDAALSPSIPEVLSVLATLPSTSAGAKLFLCSPSSGAYARARRELLRSPSSLANPFTLTGACMTQQSTLLLHELLLNSLSMEEALDNAVLVADALFALPPMRRRVLGGVYADDNVTDEDANAFTHVSVASWRSIALAVKQATRLEPFLRVAISAERSSTPSSPILRQLLEMGASDMAWNTLRHTSQLLAPLHFLSAMSELQSTSSGQMLALWIWLFGVATRSPLLDGNADAFVSSFLERLGCYVEEHFIACLVLDPRVHGAGLSASGLRRARGVAVGVAATLVPDFNENNFLRSYNDYMKQQGDFGEPGVWNAVNTCSPMDFWSDYEGDPLHSQLAALAKTLCSFVPHTCSLEELWAAHAERSSGDAAAASDAKLREKCTKIRLGAALDARPDVKTVVSRYQTLLDVDNDASVEEMLQSNEDAASDGPAPSARDLSVRSVLQSIQDGLGADKAAMEAPSSLLDATWFDVSSGGLEKIRESMDSYLSAAMQQ